MLEQIIDIVPVYPVNHSLHRIRRQSYVCSIHADHLSHD